MQDSHNFAKAQIQRIQLNGTARFARWGAAGGRMSV